MGKMKGKVARVQTVDEFLQQKVFSEHQDIVTKLRKLMKDWAPTAREVISYGILAWRGKKFLAVVSPTKKDITFAFSRGADFEDKYGLLAGAGHVSKHVKIKNIVTMNEGALRYYGEQAVQLEAK